MCNSGAATWRPLRICLNGTLQIYREVGDGRSAVQNALELGWMMATQEQGVVATAYFRRGLQEAATFNLVPQMLEGLLGLGHIRLATGDPAPGAWVPRWLAALSTQPDLLERALLNPYSHNAYLRLTALYGPPAAPANGPPPDLAAIVDEALCLDAPAPVTETPTY